MTEKKVVPMWVGVLIFSAIILGFPVFLKYGPKYKLVKVGTPEYTIAPSDTQRTITEATPWPTIPMIKKAQQIICGRFYTDQKDGRFTQEDSFVVAKDGSWCKIPTSEPRTSAVREGDNVKCIWQSPNTLTEKCE